MITFILALVFFFYLLSISKRISKIEQRLNSQTVQQPTTSKAVAPSGSTFEATVTPKKATDYTAMATPAASPVEPKNFINYLPKIGILALIFGLAFFLKYAIDQGWISIYLRLALGGVIGALLLVLYYLWREKYAKYALALAGGGIAIWYLTTFAAVQMYHVLSMDGGLIVLSLVTIIGLLVAYKTQSAALSALAWGGAYLSPMLLGVTNQSYTLMLIYITVVSAALLISIFYNKNKSLFVLTIVGAGLNLLWGSFGIWPDSYQTNTLIFLLIHLFANTVTLIALVKEGGSTASAQDQQEYSVLAMVVYLVFGIPLTIITYYHFMDYASLIMAALGVWTFLIYSLVDRLELKSLNYVLSGFGAAILSTAVIWQFGDNSQVVMLYILGLVGIIVGSIQKRFELRAWGLAVILVGLFAACTIFYTGVPMLFITEKFGLEMLGLVALGIAYGFFKNDQLTEFEGDIHQGLQYIIAVGVWFFVSWDLIHYFKQFDQVNQRNLSLSIWWLVYAVVLITLSVIKPLKALRKLSLLLFGLVILKVFLFDVSSLDTVYRITSFISLGVILLIVSFIYQHNKEKIKQYLGS